MPINMLDGPIPGENYTSDTRNYPWHRAPQYTSLDDALGYMIDTFSKPNTSIAIVTMMEIGLDIATITGILLMKGVSVGKWSIDLALLMAGPLAHMLIIMAKAYDVKYELGFEEKYTGPTKAFFEAQISEFTPDEETAKEVKGKQETVKEAATGFLAMGKKDKK